MSCPKGVGGTNGCLSALGPLILLAGLMPVAALAEPTSDMAQIVARGQMAGLAGSERLQLFAWGQWLETGQAPRQTVDAMRNALNRQGYYHDGGTPALVWSDAWASPMLAYDTNVNGGVTQESFSVSGFLFEADPAFLAISDVVLGLDTSAIARIAWGTGHTIEATVDAAFGVGLDSGLTLFASTVQLCSRNNPSRWIFVDGCLLRAASERDLAGTTLDQASLSVSSLFQTPAGYHELTGQLTEARTNGYDQTSATLMLDTVWDQAVTGLSVTLGEPVENTTVLDRRIALDVRWQLGGSLAGPLNGSLAGIGLWHETSSGGTFLGLDQIDKETGVILSWQPRPRTTVEAGYARTLSTADLYDNESFSFQIRFAPFGP